MMIESFLLIFFDFVFLFVFRFVFILEGLRVSRRATSFGPKPSSFLLLLFVFSLSVLEEESIVFPAFFLVFSLSLCFAFAFLTPPFLYISLYLSIIFICSSFFAFFLSCFFLVILLFFLVLFL